MRHAGQLLREEPGQGRSREGETRARILDAAIECFTQFGNDKTTLNDVAGVAGLARQTIYRYFPDRASLLEAVDSHEALRFREHAARIADEAESLEEFLALLIENRARVNNSYRTRQHLVAHDRGLFNSILLSRERNLERIRDAVTPRLLLAIDRGELRAGVDVAGAAEWIAISVGSLATLTRARSFDLDDPAAVGRFVARNICRGLAAGASVPLDSGRAGGAAAEAPTDPPTKSRPSRTNRPIAHRRARRS
jgi:AcrR family transcriptional regulator